MSQLKIDTELLVRLVRDIWRSKLSRGKEVTSHNEEGHW